MKGDTLKIAGAVTFVIAFALLAWSAQTQDDTITWSDAALFLLIAAVYSTIAALSWKLGKRWRQKHAEKDERLRHLAEISGLVAWASLPYIFLVIFAVEAVTKYTFQSADLFVFVNLLSALVFGIYYHIQKQRIS